MKKLPIGIQSIKKILKKREYVYVDKTSFALKLINEGMPHYFISRPRRFGKSLFINTLEEIFYGNKDLFKGCFIYDSGYTWEKYPVLHFDFAKIDSFDSEIFRRGLEDTLDDLAHYYNLSIEGSSYLSKLNRLVANLSEQNRVVVLVDEYDSPIINNLKKPKVAEEIGDLLKAFFATLKSLDKYLRFSFITGVSKFSQVSLFSGPNNLKDITMDARFAGIMGYPQEELEDNFEDYISVIVRENDHEGKYLSREDVLKELRDWYNGYQFTKDPLRVYNPFSTLNFMDEKEVQSYWYNSGTPSFLLKEINKNPQAVLSLRGSSALKSTLSDISRVDRIHLPAIMFQTGYLTIRGYDAEENSYVLDFPNREVKVAFFYSLLQEFIELDPLDISRSSQHIKYDLQKLRLDKFFNKMNVHFAKIPYHVFQNAREGFYQAVFFTFLETSGLTTFSELATNVGRIDLVTEFLNTFFIFELKLDQIAEVAFDQILSMRYQERFSLEGKEIVVIGVNFSSDSRNISDWKAALYDSFGRKLRVIEN